MWKFFNKSKYFKDHTKDEHQKDKELLEKMEITEKSEYLCWMKEAAKELSTTSRIRKSNNFNKK